MSEMLGDVRTSKIRRFNRVVTQRVGTLSDRYLARSRTLGAARVLWEIGTEGCEVRTLRTRLGLDSGQLSRLLRSLETDRLIELMASPTDARIRFARGSRRRGSPSARSWMRAAMTWHARSWSRSPTTNASTWSARCALWSG